MSVRSDKFTGELRESIQNVIQRGLQDPRISGLITITEVRLSPDNREATVMVSVLPRERERAVISGLGAAAGHIRHVVGDAITNRRIPDLHFRLDERTKKQAEVFQALQQAADERQKRQDSTPAPDA